jgi:hypothetical protein
MKSSTLRPIVASMFAAVFVMTAAAPPALAEKCDPNGGVCVGGPTGPAPTPAKTGCSFEGVYAECVLSHATTQQIATDARDVSAILGILAAATSWVPVAPIVLGAMAGYIAANTAEMTTLDKGNGVTVYDIIAVGSYLYMESNPQL